MAYPRKPTMGSDLDDPMRRTRPTSPMASASPALPAYRTEGGFKQTPTPVNPAPRTPMSATPAPTNPAFRSPTAGSVAPVRPATPSLRGASTLGKIGVAGEAARVGIAGYQGGRSAALGEAVGGASRLGAARLGAEALGRLPLPRVAKPVAAAVGGIGGYALGEAGVDAVSSAIPQPLKTASNVMDVAGDIAGPQAIPNLTTMAGSLIGQGSTVQQVPGQMVDKFRDRLGVKRPDPAAGPARSRPQNPAFSTLATARQMLVGGAAGTLPGTPAGAAPAAGAPGAADGGADPNRVLGTFNGRPITQAQADELAGQLPTANGMPAVVGDNYVASTGVRRPTADGAREPGRVARPVAQVNAPMTDNYYTRQADEQRRKVMSDIDSQLFALRGRGMTYRSGRDAAAQLLATQAGLVNAGANNAAGAAGDERNTRANIALQNAQAQNAQTLKDAELEGAQQIARGNNTTQLAAQVLEGRRARRPGVITTADGRTGAVDDSGTFRPVLDATGKPVRVGTDRRAEVSPDKLLEVYGAELAAIRQAAGKDDDKLNAGIAALNASPLGRSYAQALGGAASGPVAIGTIENDDETGQPMRFLGGNPADPTRWQEVK
jgi:hypothetical protein